jgi:NAD(P)-dependent dehydrogenase (short-subunit alcohol dehydrogenase family)
LNYVIVTGGYGGIGRHLSIALLNSGYHVIVLGRSRSKFDDVFDDIDSNKMLEFFRVDVSDKMDVESFYSHVIKYKMSSLALINAAGIQSPIGAFADNSVDEWEKSIAVNLMGTGNMIRGSLPLFKHLRSGKIINFSGGGATGPRPYFSAYAVTKTALVKLTEILAIELMEYSIDINAVAPGAINTDMLNQIIESGQSAGKEYDLAIERRNSGGESPRKIVELCNFLISQKSTGITGRLISAIWDDYSNSRFISRLKTDPDFCRLRRIDQNHFDRTT